MRLLEPSSTGKRASSQLTTPVAWLAVTTVAAFLHPSAVGHGTHEQLGMPPCPSVLLFDRPCPGCGLTTSWTAVVHGRLDLAFHAHPLGPILYAVFTAFAFFGVYAWWTRQIVRTDGPWFNRVAMASALVFVGFGAIRMAMMPHYGSDQERLLASFSRQVNSR